MSIPKNIKWVGVDVILCLTDQIEPPTALREISGTYWLIYVSLAIVSRLTRIIRSIDPTVENFQVNDPDLWSSPAEMKITI